MGGIQSRDNSPLTFSGTPQVEQFGMRVSERFLKEVLSENTVAPPPSMKVKQNSSSIHEIQALEQEQRETDILMKRLDELSHQLSTLESVSTTPCADTLQQVMTCYEQNPKKALYCHDQVQEFQQCAKRVRDQSIYSLSESR
jgi:hypothetical protein